MSFPAPEAQAYSNPNPDTDALVPAPANAPPARFIQPTLNFSAKSARISVQPTTKLGARFRICRSSGFALPHRALPDFANPLRQGSEIWTFLRPHRRMHPLGVHTPTGLKPWRSRRLYLHAEDRDAAGGGREQPAADRAVEPVARRQFGGQHARSEHDHHGAREEQAQLNGREMHRLDQDAQDEREHRKQPAHDQAHGRGRHHEAAVGDQAEIISGNRQRIERRPRRVMGFAQHGAIGERAEHGKGGNNDSSERHPK